MESRIIHIISLSHTSHGCVCRENWENKENEGQFDGQFIMHYTVFIENKENRENKEYVGRLCMLSPPVFRENKENREHKDWLAGEEGLFVGKY